MNTSLIDSRTMQHTAEAIAHSAGRIIMEKYHQARTLTYKGTNDFTTDADFAAQKHITAAIQDHFPRHGFLTEEENDNLPTDGRVVWIIDPIDGTTNYSRQIPNFSISIAAARIRADKRPEIIVGVVYDPLRDETFSARRGHGAFLNGEALQTAGATQIDEAIYTFDWGRSAEMRHASITYAQRLIPYVKSLRTIGSAALAVTWIAAGRVDVYLNLGIKPWDIAAAQLILQEAGGKLTTVDGRPWRFTADACLASSGRWHAHLLDLLPQPTPVDR